MRFFDRENEIAELRRIREVSQETARFTVLTGPRQVGKTTLVKEQTPEYISWDREKDRQLILSGAEKIAEKIGLGALSEDKVMVAFDEIHRYPRCVQGFITVVSCRSEERG